MLTRPQIVLVAIAVVIPTAGVFTVGTDPSPAHGGRRLRGGCIVWWIQRPR